MQGVTSVSHKPPNPSPLQPPNSVAKGDSPVSRKHELARMPQIIADFVNAERDETRSLFYRSLRAIEQAFSAKKEYLTKEGQIIYGGPDHYARWRATKHFRARRRERVYRLPVYTGSAQM